MPPPVHPTPKPTRPITIFLLQLLGIFLLTRVTLMIMAWPMLSHTATVWTKTFLTGFRYDVLMALVFATPFALAIFLLPHRFKSKPWVAFILESVFFVALFFFLFQAIVEIAFFMEKAKSHPFFNKTVFAVIGDHGARVYGADFIPQKSHP